MTVLFFKLLIGHALADFPLQGQFIGDFKNWNNPCKENIWWILMTAHCLIHAGVVWYVTGRGEFAVVEFFLHYLIDCAKNGSYLNFKSDQGLHLICKIGYVLCLK